MGATGMQKPQDVKAYLDDIYSRYSDPERDYRILRSTIVAASEYYCAVESVHRFTGERVVFAGVAKLRFPRKTPDGIDFIYRDMSEDCGPVYTRCPVAILDLLTETTNEYALNWRNKCRERATRGSIADGAVLRFEQPLRFTGYGEFQEFTAIRYGRAWRFRMPNGIMCRIDGWQDRTFEVVG